MPITIQQIHDLHQQGILADSSPLDEVIGTVKSAFNPRDGEYGPWQSFTLQDATGEISVTYSGSKDKPFVPVKKGDQVRLFSSMNGKNQKVGLKKGSYEGRAQLKCFNLQNASAPVAAQPQAYGQPPIPSGSGPRDAYPAALSMPGESSWASQAQGVVEAAMVAAGGPAFAAHKPPVSSGPGRAKLGESEARRIWLRQVRELAASYGDFGTDEEMVGKLPEHVFTECCKAATTILLGIQKGDITIEEGLTDEVQGEWGMMSENGGPPWENR